MQLQPQGPHQGEPQGLDGIPAAGGGAPLPEGGQEGEAPGMPHLGILGGLGYHRLPKAATGDWS